ncbi:hypothetical protein ACFLIM_44495 [Nonomuraea sp. M3C6]|uniref:Uncharacterized protein n=1 Tax=Nonomuraea marmarensis TaxID=3351344 RepID=A0ABW7AS51_9ACTN
MAYVSGFARATTSIHPGMAVSGTNALLMNSSGNKANPVIAKNVPGPGRPRRGGRRTRGSGARRR